MKAMRIVGVWILLACVAVVCGMAREALLTPALGALRAHQLGTLLVCAAIFGVSYAAIPMLMLGGIADAWKVGAIWLGMTVAFEFLFGHYVVGHPWDRLFADYDLHQGRIWPLVLLTTFVSPAAAFRLRHQQ